MKIINKIKEHISKISIKTRIFIIIGIIIFITILTLMIHLNNKHKEFLLDNIYDVYPSEVKELYRYLVDANCDGDLKFNVEVDKEAKEVKDIDKNNLIDYAFSYLDKKGYLADKMKKDLFKETSSILFNDNIDIFNGINNYDYKDYTYTFKGKEVTRKNKKCNSDITYVSHLYGYSSKDNVLKIDIYVGYIKDDILYDLSNKELGKFENNKKGELFKNSLYYRIYYNKVDNDYKLSKIKLINKS